MKKKHIIKSGKRLIKKKIQSIKESKQPKFLFEGKLEDLKKSWTEFVNGARREGKETTEAAKILAKVERGPNALAFRSVGKIPASCASISRTHCISYPHAIPTEENLCLWPSGWRKHAVWTTRRVFRNSFGSVAKGDGTVRL